jgi:3-hydroxyisobutyrate dehydrogenase-like beta-hydroxyacid dehydrogenase
MPLVKAGATLVDREEEVFETGGIVFSILSDDDAVRSVTVGNPEFLRRLGPGGVHVSMSTISPATARYLAEQHSKHEVSYLGSPVSGRPDRAAARKLFVLLAGKREAKERVRPLLEAIGERIFDFGEDPWSSNIAKLALNSNVLAAVECMAESFAFAEKNGIAPREQLRALALGLRPLRNRPHQALRTARLFFSAPDAISLKRYFGPDGSAHELLQAFFRLLRGSSVGRRLSRIAGG